MSCELQQRRVRFGFHSLDFCPSRRVSNSPLHPLLHRPPNTKRPTHSLFKLHSLFLLFDELIYPLCIQQEVWSITITTQHALSPHCLFQLLCRILLSTVSSIPFPLPFNDLIHIIIDRPFPFSHPNICLSIISFNLSAKEYPEWYPGQPGRAWPSFLNTSFSEQKLDSGNAVGSRRQGGSPLRLTKSSHFHPEFRRW